MEVDADADGGLRMSRRGHFKAPVAGAFGRFDYAMSRIETQPTRHEWVLDWRGVSDDDVRAFVIHYELEGPMPWGGSYQWEKRLGSWGWRFYAPDEALLSRHERMKNPAQRAVHNARLRARRVQDKAISKRCSALMASGVMPMAALEIAEQEVRGAA